MICEPVAPTLRSVAMTLTRLSMNVATAFAMPTPPTRSDASPIRMRNCLSRSSVRVICGEGS